MGAIVALRGSMVVRVDVKRVIRTCLHTRFAADAARIVEIDDAIFALIQCFRRANLDARSVITMIAAIDEEIAARIGELAPFDVLDPRAIDAEGNIMFSLTRNRTGMAADTLALVNNKCVLSHGRIPSFVV